VQVREGGTFIMKSGAITGNTSLGEDWVSGGGVRVWKGTFTMEGGTISGNSAASSKEGGSGGGVYIAEGSVFTMTGGSISGNSADGRGASGGGVSVEKGSVFTMENGEISGNSATGKKYGFGGGVFVNGDENNDSTFIMSGGIISGNNVSGSFAHGGGVKVSPRSIFTMEGGEISGNNASNDSRDAGGGGVYVESDSRGGVGVFTMLGGTVYGSASAANAGGKANETRDDSGAPITGRGAAIMNGNLPVVAKWGTGGTYTKGGVPQSGGSDIGRSDETLIAIPAK
jgi:hypothetical protein